MAWKVFDYDASLVSASQTGNFKDEVHLGDLMPYLPRREGKYRLISMLSETWVIHRCHWPDVDPMKFRIAYWKIGVLVFENNHQI